MTYGTGTMTRSVVDAITMVNVRHVAWRIETDLRVLRVQHQMVTADWEARAMHDLTLLMYRGYIARIDLNFTDVYGRLHSGSVSYSITRSWQGGDDDDAGGLRVFDSSQLRFGLQVKYTAPWWTLMLWERAAIATELKLSWAPMPRPTGNGYWVTDRNFGNGSLGAARSVFKSY